MSHVSVYVTFSTRPSEADLHKALMPFHEYESDGIKEYIEKIDITDEVIEEYNKFAKNKMTFDEYAISEYNDGCFKIYENGKVYKYTNPNAKWNSYIVGGAFRNLVKSYMATDIDKFNADNGSNLCFKKKDISMAVTDVKKKIAAKIESLIDECCDSGHNWYDVLAFYDRKLAEYSANSSKDYDIDKYMFETITGGDLHCIVNNCITITEDELILRYMTPITRAILYNGKWYENYDISFREWHEEFAKIWNSIPDEYWIVLVDCRI